MRRTASFSLLLAIAALASAAQSIDSTGVWLATDVPYAPWTISLKQEATALTGTMRQNGGLTGTANIYEGAIDGDKISFKANSPDGARAIAFTGTIHGDEITLHRSTRIITNASQGGNGLFGTNAAPQFTLRRGVAPPAPVRLSYKGVTIDVTSVQSAPNREAILDGLRRQIDITDEAVTDPAQKAFLKSVPLTVAETATPGANTARYSSSTKSVDLMCWLYDSDKPVILHELMHAYHDQKLPNGMRNAEIQRLYEQARDGGQFPADAYMLKNAAEYFAMMSSVYLHGSAAHDPNTRQSIKEKQPECYQWLVKEFGAK